jgi:aspartokinase
VDAVRVTDPVATVSVVGAPNSDGAGLVPRTFAALGLAHARVLAMAQSAAAYHVSFVIHEAAVNDVVRVLHQELGLGSGGV